MRAPGEQHRFECIDDRDAHFPIITSEALITAATLSPTFRPSSSTASFVIDDVTFVPLPRSTSTCAVVAPFLSSTSLPLSWLRALRFIIFLRQIRASRHSSCSFAADSNACPPQLFRGKRLPIPAIAVAARRKCCPAEFNFWLLLWRPSC